MCATGLVLSNRIGPREEVRSTVAMRSYSLPPTSTCNNEENAVPERVASIGSRPGRQRGRQDRYEYRETQQIDHGGDSSA